MYLAKNLCLLITGLFLQWHITTNAQRIDSIMQIIQQKKLSTTEKINVMNKLSWDYAESNPQLSETFANQSVILAKKEKNSQLLTVAYHHKAIALYNQNKTDSADFFMQDALKSAGSQNDFLGKIYLGLGNIQADKGNYEVSLSYYLQALIFFEKHNKEVETAQVLSNIGSLYYNLGEYDKMYEYHAKSLLIHRKIGSKKGIATNQANLANYYFYKNDKNNTIKSLTEAQKLFHELKMSVKESNVLGDIGDYYSFFLADYDRSIQIYNQAIGLLKDNENNNIRMDLYRKISLAYYHKSNYENAVNYMHKAVATTDSTNLDLMRMNYNLLAYNYIGLKNSEKATEALDKYVDLTDKVYRKNLKKNISEMEVKYQTEKKEFIISNLLKEKKLYGIITFSVLFSLLTMILALFLRHKNIKAQKQLTEQKVSHLEQEKKLVVTQAVLEGEEAERTRLANDLHDGLGGLLSGVKLNLSAMKENSLLSSENAAAFNKTIGLLDNSIRELRRIAHNLIPENLMRLGLRYALSEFIHSFNMDNPQITFHFYGEETRYAKELELTVYRITQELVNNAVKHSRASHINVQLIMENERINVQVIDDGVSFDTSIIEKLNKGTGLQQIKNRVNAMNGRFEIVSKPNEGTEAYIEFSSN